MEKFLHKVNYYETDRMGITHHSNYIRWMEEARVDFLERIGWCYEKLEKEGIMSPVIRLECDYKLSTTFADVVAIEVAVEEFSGLKLKLGYRMYNAEEKLVFEAKSEHCFLDEKGRLIRLKNRQPEFYECLRKLAEERKEEAG
ncbi:MAG: acyl-CoA thioesterase [Lachnospiraceae bacterium]|nr:acyl-CoA thioesterase [Lachnospiraceae bacterium]